MTNHKIYYQLAQDMAMLEDQSVNLVVTSPPYPMIEMWDEIMMKQNVEIKKAFEANEFNNVFELMHIELDKIWSECYRVLKEGGIACINIGDATRTLDKNFALYSNHTRIIHACLQMGFQNLPNIIWRKQTNAPNKFMGSGMLPPGAYVTLEHEYILILRKGRKREFKSIDDKENRQTSSYFWEERNQWFSDLWDLKGTTQKLVDKKTRERSAAYPFQLPYRLINMFSVQGDTILDPFMGTGTTALAAIAAHRNSIGFEVDTNLEDTIKDSLLTKEEGLNKVIEDRLMKHINFVDQRKKLKGEDAFKYTSKHYDFPVITKQEANLKLPFVEKISFVNDQFTASYLEEVSISRPNALALF